MSLDYQLDYLNKLCGIELLRKASLGRASVQLAWQYGQAYNTPWKDNEYMVREFHRTHQDELRKFTCFRLLRLVHKLLEGKKLIGKAPYKLVPMEPEVVASIRANLDRALKERRIQELLDHEFKLSKSLFKNALVRATPYNFAELESLDTLLVGHFNSFKLMLDKNGYNNKPYIATPISEFLRNDGMISQCFICLEEIYHAQIEDINPDFNNFKAWACMFSILYHLVTPFDYDIDSLDNLVKRAFVSARAKGYGRTYSALSIEDVADDRLPMLNPKLIHDSYSSDYVPMSVPGSLVEKYLTTEYALNEIKSKTQFE